MSVSEEIVKKCVDLATEFSAEGHRADYVTALAARAHAALRGAPESTAEDVEVVAPLALPHRRPEFLQGGAFQWSEDDRKRVIKVLNHV